MPEMSMPTTTDDLTAQVDDELRGIVGSRDMPLYGMMSYHLGWGDASGRFDTPVSMPRTHGVLCLLASTAAGGDTGVALPAAAAVELVHNFCQIHGDVEAGSPQRGDRDALWWVWGPAQAINAGDGMHALARLALFRLLQRGVSSTTTFRAVQILDEASLQTCEGRFLELEAQERIDMSVPAYLKMASKKAGALPSCAMKLGGLVAAAEEPVLDALETCGTKLGLAMQIRDDLLAIWGDGQEPSAASPEVLNKTKLLPVVQALEKASLADKRALGDVYFKRVLEPGDVVKVREVIERLGAREDCEALVERYREEALRALDTTGVSAQGKLDIQQLADSLLGRGT